MVTTTCTKLKRKTKIHKLVYIKKTFLSPPFQVSSKKFIRHELLSNILLNITEKYYSKKSSKLKRKNDKIFEEIRLEGENFRKQSEVWFTYIYTYMNRINKMARVPSRAPFLILRKPKEAVWRIEKGGGRGVIDLNGWSRYKFQICYPIVPYFVGRLVRERGREKKGCPVSVQ